MSHQFKPGDLAMIIKGENSGRVVNLVQRYVGPVTIQNEKGKQSVPDGVIAWTVDANDLIATYTKTGKQVLVSRVAGNEKSLMPLRGDFEPEQQKVKEAEPCA
ncbi:hypothetical protein [Pseudomonas urethralis]|uniref:hypothetical protein n=1 Tax=Pseudomonas urethralis TaxID=2740517 RepID=UPI00159648FB|nr:hypothetical protein [Pseudomonas urethralis]